jgi:serine/threonine protein kinase
MNEESLFAAALERSDLADRQKFIEESCGEDAAMRRRIEKLLRADEHAAGILEHGPDDVALPTTPEPPVAADRLFAGRFKLRQKLGEGGMGEVWVADQLEPVQRRVALKVIRPDRDSASMLARFEQERQALALMDHTNIARVLDAGIDETGHPFFAMELIKGIPISKYCDEAKLSPRQRLELFIPVCHAVQHAHQKGIIHRDIKPSNILVALYDGRPVPKVIDFGVAKSIGQRLTDRSIYTEVGALIGTLEYMSPEQAELNNLDIDTRTDIYALGAVLYELLTGSVPFSRKELQTAAFTEMLRIIKEVDPPKPSTKLSGSGTLASVAVARQSEPKKLIALVRGELDWIVMKALEKDRNRRYATANDLGADVLHYLQGEAVEACPPSASYRLRKFARKYRAALTTAAALALLLVAGVAISAWQAIRATEAESQIRIALVETRQAKDEKETALHESEEARDQAEAVKKYLVKLLQSPNPANAGRVVKITDLLDRAPAQLDADFADSPKIKADILDALGETYAGLRLYEKASQMREKVLTLRRSALGQDNPDTILAMRKLAWAYRGAGRPEEAIALAQQALVLQEARLGADHRETLLTAAILGDSFRTAQQPADAIRVLEPSLRLCRAKLGSKNDVTMKTMNNLALAYGLAGRATEAVSLFEETLEVMKAQPSYDPEDTLNLMNNLGEAYVMDRRRTQAVALLEESLKLCMHKLGPGHLTTQNTMDNLVTACETSEQRGRIEPLLLESVAFMRLDPGSESPELASALMLLGSNRLKLQKYAAAETPIRECLGIREKTQSDNWRTFNAKSMLGACLLGQNQFTDAEPLLLSGYRAMKEREAKIPARGKIRLTESLERLVQLYDAWGKQEEADKWRKELETTQGK